MSTQCRPKTGHLSNAQAAFRQVEDASVAPNRLPECQGSSPAPRASVPRYRVIATGLRPQDREPLPDWAAVPDATSRSSDTSASAARLVTWQWLRSIAVAELSFENL